jgi:pyocin large subunit-like protein
MSSKSQNTNNQKTATNNGAVSKPKLGNTSNGKTTGNKQAPVVKKQNPTLPPFAVDSKFDKEEVTSFSDAVNFYRNELFKQIINSDKFIKHKLEIAPYIINSRTGRVDDCHMMRFDYENHDRSSVIYKDGDNQRTINMARYLLRQDFCADIADHYAKHRIKCEFFDTGYNPKTKKYKHVYIKFTF